MSKLKIVSDYVLAHPVASKMQNHHQELLLQILGVFAHESEEKALVNTSILMAYCGQELVNSESPEPAIARIAHKALDLLLNGGGQV